MIVIIQDIDYDYFFEFEIPTRPNNGDSIFLQDFDLTNKKLTKEYLYEIKTSCRFEIQSVVFGKVDGFKTPRWVIQGQLDR